MNYGYGNGNGKGEKETATPLGRCGLGARSFFGRTNVLLMKR